MTWSKFSVAILLYPRIPTVSNGRLSQDGCIQRWYTIDLTIQNWYLSCEDPWGDTKLLHCQKVVLRFVGLISWLSARCVPLRLECLLDKEKEEMKNRSLGHDWHSHTRTIFSTICLMLVTLYCIMSILTLCSFRLQRTAMSRFDFSTPATRYRNNDIFGYFKHWWSRWSRS